jgi:hypothetical protein
VRTRSPAFTRGEGGALGVGERARFDDRLIPWGYPRQVVLAHEFIHVFDFARYGSFTTPEEEAEITARALACRN